MLNGGDGRLCEGQPCLRYVNKEDVKAYKDYKDLPTRPTTLEG